MNRFDGCLSRLGWHGRRRPFPAGIGFSTAGRPTLLGADREGLLRFFFAAPGIAGLLLSCLAARAETGAGPWEIRNDYWLVRGKGGVITQAWGDVRGRGNHTSRLAGRLFPGEQAPTGEGRWERVGETLRVSGINLLTAGRAGGVGGRDTSVPLEAGRTLGQSFAAPDGLARVGACLPTWMTTGARAVLRLKRGGPSGEVIAQRTCGPIADNSWEYLSFEPQPAGRYYLELSQPVGRVGWWALSGNPYAQGGAYRDGQEIAGMDFQFRYACYTTTPAELEVTLSGPVLHVKSNPAARLQLETPWQREGYGVKHAAAHWFTRFMSDDGRYLPAEQLKRRAEYEHALRGRRWIHLGGSWGADWHLEPYQGWMHFVIESKSLTLLLNDNLSVRVMQPGWIPGFLPRFTASDEAFAHTLTRFLHERALSWPLDPGFADWMEWLALIRDWMDLPGYLRRERAHLLSYKMTEQGYVHTWGDAPEWPFPDNEKYDARHFTTNAMFILGCHRYFCWTRDAEFLAANMGRLRKAMDFQLGELEGRGGLLVMTSPDHDGTPAGVHSNYWDDLPFGYKSAYENIYFYASLGAMADLEEAAGNRSRAAYLRALQEKVGRRYREAFWNDEAGRFIGCIDKNGVKRDYGFTYVNMEAMAYGLATREQATRIYRWMETQPTETGKADTYSRYIFAPRVNTVDCSGWWYLHGKAEIPSQPFGKHLENGGAILYTSGFDIMARARYLGADNAFQRLREILRRYQEPDRLCGGSPLSRGENNGWEVGTDIPFPESGIAPASFLYAFLGVQATAQGLQVRPNLPRALKWAGVENLVYRGLPLNIRVSKASVTVSCNLPGREFSVTRRVGPQEAFILRTLPQGRSFPRLQYGGGWRAKWIWLPGTGARRDEVMYARRVFRLDRKPALAAVWVTADDSYELWLNGSRVGEGGGWDSAERHLVGGLLRKGPNVVAVRVRNADGPAGLLLEMRWKGGSLLSDGSWKAAAAAESGWTSPGFDASDWASARELGPVPVGPWGEIYPEPDAGAER